MKKVILSLSLLVFFGCQSDLNKWTLSKAEDFCKDKGGIHHLSIDSNITISGWIYCDNGERLSLSKLK